MKDLDVGEVWANYTLSYVNVAIADAHRNEFTTWSSNYLLKDSSADDLEANENDLETMYTTKNLYRGIAKYYA